MECLGMRFRRSAIWYCKPRIRSVSGGFILSLGAGSLIDSSSIHLDFADSPKGAERDTHLAVTAAVDIQIGLFSRINLHNGLQLAGPGCLAAQTGLAKVRVYLQRIGRVHLGYFTWRGLMMCVTSILLAVIFAGYIYSRYFICFRVPAQRCQGFPLIFLTFRINEPGCIINLTIFAF